jgi:hypothetical protein
MFIVYASQISSSQRKVIIMSSKHYHNARSATIAIVSSFLLIAAMTFAAQSASASQTSPVVFHQGNVTARGFVLMPSTSRPLECQHNERTVAYEVATVSPYVISVEVEAGVMDAFMVRNQTVAVVDTADHVVANVNRYKVNVQVICER